MLLEMLIPRTKSWWNFNTFYFRPGFPPLELLLIVGVLPPLWLPFYPTFVNFLAPIGVTVSPYYTIPCGFFVSINLDLSSDWVGFPSEVILGENIPFGLLLLDPVLYVLPVDPNELLLLKLLLS